MLYKILQCIVRLNLQLFCSKITIQNKELLKSKGPLLIIANHPNSFFDAILIAAYFKQKVYSLARGDAFTKPWHNFLLRSFNMIPIYRINEGKENLQHNYKTFEQCQNILANNGILLIFIEGVCKNTHQLQPFKKGATRIIEDCLQNKIPLKIMPLALGYSSFNKLPLNAHINLQKSITANKLQLNDLPYYKAFNAYCYSIINNAITIPTQHHFGLSKTILYLLGFPVFKFLNNFITTKTKNTVFYHSVLFAIYLLLFILVLLSILIVIAIKLL